MEWLGKLPGPFADALKTARERTSKRAEQLIEWRPWENNQEWSVAAAFAPSLLSLSFPSQRYSTTAGWARLSLSAVSAASNRHQGLVPLQSVPVVESDLIDFLSAALLWGLSLDQRIH